MIAYVLTTADRYESDFQALAGIRTIGLQGLGTLQRRAAPNV
jgi:hypothetical protein